MNRRLLMAVLLALSVAFGRPATLLGGRAHVGLSHGDGSGDLSHWQGGMLGGNGRMGVIVMGGAAHESIVFCDRACNFPGDAPRRFAQVPADTIAKIRRLCAAGRFAQANALAVSAAHWADGGQGGRHPAFALVIDMQKGTGGDAAADVLQRCDYATGELCFSWSETAGAAQWRRSCFVSRADDVFALNLTRTDESTGTFDAALTMNLAGMNFPDGMRCRTWFDASDATFGIAVSYPAPHADEGYAARFRVEAPGGQLRFHADTLFVRGASGLVLVGATGDAPSAPGRLARLAAEGYDALLARHAAIHGELFGRVGLSLRASDAERALTNEELLAMQAASQQPVAALWERLFDAGRYHFICSSDSLSPPDLLGLWTGDCKVGWGGFYHLDANLNLQVSGGNIGALPELMEGYFHLNEAWADDFRTNASRLLGCRGLLACGNTPGASSGLMASINDYYPYHYATGEEAWLLYPFWEHWLVTRDDDFLRTRLYPLLREMADFYADFLVERDSLGHYVFAGSISPENQPRNLRVSLLNNSAFDVSGARFLLSTLLRAARHLRCDRALWPAWQAMLRDLPPYRINADGALKEWGWDGLDDEYDHRHLSHLMMVWPYDEWAAAPRPDMEQAARRAFALRDEHSYENAGHGLLHAALIAARLKERQALLRKLLALSGGGYYYRGLATSHYSNHGVFCTDVAHALPTVLEEMLVHSTDNRIELLPALVDGLESGSLEGLLTRCGVELQRVEWSRARGTVSATLCSPRRTRVVVACGGAERRVGLAAGRPVTISLPL